MPSLSDQHEDEVYVAMCAMNPNLGFDNAELIAFARKLDSKMRIEYVETPSMKWMEFHFSDQSMTAWSAE